MCRPKYGDAVMLVSDDTYQGIGGVALFPIERQLGLGDGFVRDSEQFLDHDVTYGVPSATVQTAQSIFAVETFPF